MKFSEIIAKVNSDKRLVPDLLKTEKGNNFRAVSEAAILDVIDPILTKEQFYYTIHVKEQHLDIREAFGSKGKKLQFIATLTIQVSFYYWDGELVCTTEAVGMGIDDNDKAMGKAYTYAVKYALLKLFRLRYGDDTDFKASEPLHTEKPKEDKKEDKPKEDKKTSKGKEPLMTEKQRDYILGMMQQKNVSEAVIIQKFDVEPSRDENIPMKVARAIIKYLEELNEEDLTDDDLPF